MKYKSLTQWFPDSMWPVRAGWYEVQSPTIIGRIYMLWTGEDWEYHGAKLGAQSPFEWRGLAAKPKRMTAKSIDVTGEKYGMLTARARAFLNEQGAHWTFDCDCGLSRVARLKDVRYGNTASCGCMQFVKGGVQVERPWQ
jgi:hypothetical protein